MVPFSGTVVEECEDLVASSLELRLGVEPLSVDSAWQRGGGDEPVTWALLGSGSGDAFGGESTHQLCW